jgi:hypothetical protein
MTEQFVQPDQPVDRDYQFQPAPPAKGALFGQWIVEGAHTAVFLAPRWNGLKTSPWMIAALTAALLSLSILLQRFQIPGPADFYPRALLGGWFYAILLLWICYLVRAEKQGGEATPGPAHLFSMALAQLFFMSLIVGTLDGILIRTGLKEKLGITGLWAVWLLPLVWSFAAQWTLLWRSGKNNGPAVMTFAMVTLAAGSILMHWVPPYSYWYAKEARSKAPAHDEFLLTQEVMEAQPLLLEKRLGELKAQRPGTIDMYAVTFAPYSPEEVFRRESQMVAEVMSRRFDTAGRTLQLINNLKTVEQWPWASPLNLRRALARIGKTMDRNEDVLFLHLTSHGASNGQLSASFWPMSMEGLKPELLKAWLDEAGIKYRVISVSACFSGTWIKALANENTLIMTAADADHTSYGCGRKSDLTFFSRAMYDEQLRTSTLSFEDAFKAARPIIKEREEKAGKSDGYSNPQIQAGGPIREKLARLQARLQVPKTGGK